MVKRRGFLIRVKWSWHDKGTIRAECVVFHNSLGFFGDKEQSVELLIIKLLFSFRCPSHIVVSRNCLFLTPSCENNGRQYSEYTTPIRCNLAVHAISTQHVNTILSQKKLSLHHRTQFL